MVFDEYTFPFATPFVSSNTTNLHNLSFSSLSSPVNSRFALISSSYTIYVSYTFIYTQSYNIVRTCTTYVSCTLLYTVLQNIMSPMKHCLIILLLCHPYHFYLCLLMNPFYNPSLYKSIVGALQYITITRPNFPFAINKVCQFMATFFNLIG